MRSMPGSFRSRADSPHPFRLQPPPPPRAKSVNQETLEQNQASIAPNPPISTRYIDMLLDLDNISTIYNLLANLFTWLLLAGYMVFPGAFTSIGNSRVLSDNAGKAGKVVVKAAQNLPLLWVAGICCVLGASGMCWLGWLWQRNYLWLVNRIILSPGLLNSAAGLVTTIVNVYTARSGFWSVTAIATAVVTGTCTTTMIALLIVYDIWGLARIKQEHQKLKAEAEQRRVLEAERGHNMQAGAED